MRIDNSLVMEHPAVDAGVFGEGESRIGPLIATLLDNRGMKDLRGFFYKGSTGLTINKESPVSWDLERCHYPYLDGTISPSKDGTIFLETIRGCPFRCRYCYYHKAFRQVRAHPIKAMVIGTCISDKERSTSSTIGIKLVSSLPHVGQEIMVRPC